MKFPFLLPVPFSLFVFFFGGRLVKTFREGWTPTPLTKIPGSASDCFRFDNSLIYGVIIALCQTLCLSIMLIWVIKAVLDYCCVFQNILSDAFPFFLTQQRRSHSVECNGWNIKTHENIQICNNCKPCIDATQFVVTLHNVVITTIRTFFPKHIRSIL